MKKVSISLLSGLFILFGMHSFVSAQDTVPSDLTEEELQAIEEEYELGEEPEPPPAVDMEAMFGTEGTESGSNDPAAEGSEDTNVVDEPETTGGEVVDTQEVVNTYEMEQQENSKTELEECTIWSCALFKMTIAVGAIGGSAFWIFMLVDILKLGKDAFPVGMEYRKWLWFAGVLLFGVVGATVYYLEIFRKHRVN